MAAATDPSDEFVADVFARNCTSRSILEDATGKWGTLALVALLEDEFRFNALRRKVDGVSEKMLSQTLQTLERDGLVVRVVHTAIPPHVSYSLTSLGKQVATQLRAFVDLIEGSVDSVTEARQSYDERAGGGDRVTS